MTGSPDPPTPQMDPSAPWRRHPHPMPTSDPITSNTSIKGDQWGQPAHHLPEPYFEKSGHGIKECLKIRTRSRERRISLCTRCGAGLFRFRMHRRSQMTEDPQLQRLTGPGTFAASQVEGDTVGLTSQDLWCQDDGDLDRLLD
ncbi:hypothetical protein NDU88_003116 [Pleurodeles waltl]|uniref:Uncharacterized protein n=1 Tax=Pleurodeles waltl TaxID=8319 RepID=A0AAV7RER5_PLEWA|nr:hypothetical protein NDU88_003116 [Pleurodeles waltl]